MGRGGGDNKEIGGVFHISLREEWRREESLRELLLSNKIIAKGEVNWLGGEGH